MERYNKPTKDFLKSVGDIKPPKEDSKPVKDILRAAKLLKHPENVPKALIAYGLSKQASQITEEINPLELRDFLMSQFGPDWLEWVPEVLDHALLNDQKSAIISNKAQAIRICLTTDTPWSEWHIFENVGKAFNHQVPDFNIMQPLSLGECETTLKTMNDIRDESIQNEVLIYIAARAFTENYVYIPKDWECSAAQFHLDGMIYDHSLKMEVENSWDRLKDHELLDKKFNEDDAVHRQLADLAVVQQFIKEYHGSYDRSQTE